MQWLVALNWRLWMSVWVVWLDFLLFICVLQPLLLSHSLPALSRQIKQRKMLSTSSCAALLGFESGHCRPPKCCLRQLCPTFEPDLHSTQGDKTAPFLSSCLWTRKWAVCPSCCPEIRNIRDTTLGRSHLHLAQYLLYESAQKWVLKKARK